MKQKKEYVKPAMRTVELRHTGMLMTSGLQNSKSASMSVEYEEEDI